MAGTRVSDDGRGWDQILKALLKHAKWFDLFPVGSHYRILSGLMSKGLSIVYQKDNSVCSMKDIFRREQS